MKRRGAFYLDMHQPMDGLLIYRRADVKHERFYARIALRGLRKYKVIALSAIGLELAIREATEKYYETQHALKNDMAVFRKSFSQVSTEFLEREKTRISSSGKGGITFHRWRVTSNHVSKQLSQYIGPNQVSKIGRDEWANYAIWRRKNGKGRSGGEVSSATIRAEMTTLRAIMKFAAERGYVNESKIRAGLSGKHLPDNTKGDAFTRTEYRTLYRYMRFWVKEDHPKILDFHRWTRQIVRNFVLIMCHTGMRNSEARNLRWRDVFWDENQGRVIFTVFGKNKRRSFAASSATRKYLDRIKAISNAKDDNDFIFSTFDGAQSKTLYGQTVAELLKKSSVSYGSSGKRRSIYSFRHTFATFRLQAGAEVYSLAQHMGTSVEMIQAHYGHISQRDVSNNVLRGLR